MALKDLNPRYLPCMKATNFVLKRLLDPHFLIPLLHYSIIDNGENNFVADRELLFQINQQIVSKKELIGLIILNVI
jgi:hypothetical protein